MKNKLQKLASVARNIAFSTKLAYRSAPTLLIVSSIVFMVVSVIPYLPLFIWKNVVNEVVAKFSCTSEKTVGYVLTLVIFYVLSLLLQCAVKQINSIVTTRYDAEIKYHIDNFCVEKMAKIKYSYYDDPVFADKMSYANRIMYDILDVSTVLKNVLYSLTQLVISGIILGRFALWIIPIILVLCIPRYMIKLKMSDEDRKFEQKYEKSERKRDYYYGLFFGAERLEIMLYGIKDFFLGKYNREWKNRNDAYDKKNLKQLGLQILSSLVVTVSDIIFYIRLAYSALKRLIGVGDITYYVSILSSFTTASIDIVDSVITLNDISENLDYIRDVLTLDSTNESGGKERVSGDEICIEFDDVSFRYPCSEHDVLRHCSFKITGKEKIGIVGENGTGKSTILKLLLRLYEPTSGRILLNGKDIAEYDLGEYRKVYGAMFQESVDYSMSARENIIISDLEKAACENNDDCVNEAARRSRLGEIISAWEGGLDTQLTKRFDENGRELSGGQWKRFGLARTYYKDSKEILLDEPSASLDPVCEHEIFTEFTEVSNDKGAVMITHRIFNLIDMHRILVLSDGRIAEDGSHRELMNKGGIYANMFRLQADKYV